MKRKLTFDQKSTVDGRAAVAEALLGNTTGASKGRVAPEDWKIKPTGKPWKGSIGFKSTKKF